MRIIQSQYDFVAFTVRSIGASLCCTIVARKLSDAFFPLSVVALAKHKGPKTHIAHLTFSQPSKYSNWYISIKAQSTTRLASFDVVRDNSSTYQSTVFTAHPAPSHALRFASLAFTKRLHTIAKTCARGLQRATHAVVAFTHQGPRSAAVASRRPADLSPRSKRQAKKCARSA